MPLVIGVTKEFTPGERRVALVPDVAKKYQGLGAALLLQAGAGASAYHRDEDYGAAELEADAGPVLAKADVILQVQPLGLEDIAQLKPGAVLVGLQQPWSSAERVKLLIEKKITCFALELLPRISRAQSMDVLSSQAAVAGYECALIAADHCPKFFPMLTYAAGTIRPAKVLVIGAGVAGLQAIATAKRLGANVFATDVRPEVKEQIESVGARYVGITLDKSASAGGGYAAELSEADRARQRELLAEQCAASNAVITTALVGGVFAPKLITAAMVRSMKPGSVIIDLAAEGGGNCELSRPGHTVVENGVKIIAPLNLAATMPTDASVLWSRNVTNFLLAFWKDKAFNLDLNDEILRGALITHDGQIVHAKTKEAAAATTT